MRQIAHRYEAAEVNDFHLFTPSRVEFVRESKGSFGALLDGEIRVALEKRGPINGQLMLGVNEKELAEQFTEGSFFIVDGDVIDYRLKDNLKFVHNTDAIAALAETLGFSRPVSRLHNIMDDERPAVARSQTSKFECNATDSLGGQFDINIGFSWSPFDLDIHSAIELWRQVCENGAIAQSPLMNHRIPMMNKWKENLDISNHVIRHAFDKMVFPRLQALPNERISMDDAAQLLRIVRDHHGSKHLQGHQYRYLTNIQSKLEDVFTSDVSNLKSNMLKFIPAPITAFDAMNIATEVATHHTGRDKNDFRAQAFTNSLIFDANRQNNQNVDLDKLVIGTEVFNKPDQAFFGTTIH